MFANAIPSKLHQVLLRAFAPGSPYWAESDYANRGYFSWWYDIDEPPRHAVEQLIRDHLLPLVGSARDEIVGAEWWVHTRVAGHNLGHQLHYDTEERSLEATGEIVHPLVSSVCYLSGGGSAGGGPTIVFDQTVDDDVGAASGWLATPVDRGFLTFPGNRLHGVLPGGGSRSNPEARPARKRRAVSGNGAGGSGSGARAEAPPACRLTLMVGFWSRPVGRGGRRRTPYSACAPLPKETRSLRWLSTMPVVGSVDTAKSTEVPVPAVSPVWEAVPPAGRSCVPLEVPAVVDQRFFVRSIGAAGGECARR